MIEQPLGIPYEQLVERLKIEPGDRREVVRLLSQVGVDFDSIRITDIARAAVASKAAPNSALGRALLAAVGWSRNGGKNPFFESWANYREWINEAKPNAFGENPAAVGSSLMSYYGITASAISRGRSDGASASRIARSDLRRYSPWLGFHADESGQVETQLLVRKIMDFCQVDPKNANGAMALWRHLGTNSYSELQNQRIAAKQLGFEEPTIIFVPFTTGSPGTNDPAQNDAAIAGLETAVALYAGENIIGAFGNLNSSNFMVGALAADRNAAWWALEARAINVFRAAGIRWAATDDQGLVSLCQTVVARRAAWALEGIDPDDCEFFCSHEYIAAGFVPVLLTHAEDSLARVGVFTEIRITELAFGFLLVGQTDADKPWLLNEYQPNDPVGNPLAYPAHSLTWTRLTCRWMRMKKRHGLIFDWTMFVRNLALSSWGLIFTADQRDQVGFSAPALGTLWMPPDAPARAGALRFSNTDEGAEATAAAQAASDAVTAGYFFEKQA